METQQGAKGLVYDRKLEYVQVIKEIREYNQAMYFDHSQRNFLLKDFDKDFIGGFPMFVANNCSSFIDRYPRQTCILMARSSGLCMSGVCLKSVMDTCMMNKKRFM